jgi:hypothetical protein
MDRDRFRGGYERRQEQPARPAPLPDQTEVTPAEIKQRKHIHWPLIGITICLLIILGGGAAFFLVRSHSPVPKSIAKQVDFPVYYPDQKKLPGGYSLNTTSFTSPDKGVVVYSVQYGQNDKLVFSEQPKPSNAELDNFNKQRIPIHVEFTTKFGKAELGIIGQQAVVNVLLKDNVWVIITGPQTLREKDVSPVIAALKK